MDTWVAQGGQRYGPYSQEKLQEMLATGQIAASADVWIPETGQWIKALQMPGFQRPSGAVPPAGYGGATPPPGPAPYSPPGASSPYGGSPYGPSYAPAYGQAGPGTQDAGSKTNQIAIAALVIGVISFLSLIMIFTIVLAFAPAVLGILAIVLGFVGRSQIKRTGEHGSGYAIGGIVTGAVTLVVLVALVVVIVLGLVRLSEEVGPAVNRTCSQAVQRDLRNAATAQEVVFTDQQSYTRSVTELTRNGYVGTAESMNCATSPLSVELATESDYCMEMAGGGQTFAITTKGLREGTCSPAELT